MHIHNQEVTMKHLTKMSSRVEASHAGEEEPKWSVQKSEHRHHVQVTCNAASCELSSHNQTRSLLSKNLKQDVS